MDAIFVAMKLIVVKMWTESRQVMEYAWKMKKCKTGSLALLVCLRLYLNRILL